MKIFFQYMNNAGTFSTFSLVTLPSEITLSYQILGHLPVLKKTSRLGLNMLAKPVVVRLPRTLSSMFKKNMDKVNVSGLKVDNIQYANSQRNNGAPL